MDGLGLGQEIYRDSLKHLVVPENENLGRVGNYFKN